MRRKSSVSGNAVPSAVLPDDGRYLLLLVRVTIVDGLVCALLSEGNMGGSSKDKGRVTVHILEARFHHRGKSDEFVVVGRLFCCAPWVILEVAADFQDDAIVSTLTDLAMASRPRAFEALRGIDSRYWSFVSTDIIPDGGAN
jgi:hypothetical protein